MKKNNDDISGGYVAERVAQQLLELEAKIESKLERTQRQLADTLKRCDKQSDQLQQFQRSLGESKAQVVDMAARHHKAHREMNEQAARISAECEKVKALASNLEKRLEVIATPDEVVRPLVGQLRRTAKQFEALENSIQRKLERFDADLKAWVPEYRRKGRAPSG